MPQRSTGPKLSAHSSMARWPSPETLNERVPSTPPRQSSTVAVRVCLWGSAPKMLAGPRRRRGALAGEGLASAFSAWAAVVLADVVLADAFVTVFSPPGLLLKC
jgi:hypothetical protein